MEPRSEPPAAIMLAVDDHATQTTPGGAQADGSPPLVLQRHLWWVAASAVVAGAGLVLASSAPAGPAPDVLSGVQGQQDQLDHQAADLG